MKMLEKVFEFDTKENLNVKVILENLGITVVGTPEATSKLSVNITSLFNANPELIKAEYDEDTNSLTIDFRKFEDDLKIKKSKILLQVPHKSSTFVISENGKISIKHLEGNQKLENENGLIKLEKIVGNLELTNENGLISISNVLGDIKSKTENAMIKIEKAKGNIDLKSENSMIKVAGSQGKLVCKNENGLIRVVNCVFENAVVKNENGLIHYETGFVEKGNVSIMNEKGKISFYVSQTVPFDITAKTVTGKILVNVEGSMEKSKEGDAKIYHIVNGAGSLKVNIENELGGIKISSEIKPSFADKLDDFISSMIGGDKKQGNIGKLLEEKLGKKIEKEAEKAEKYAKDFIGKHKEEIFEKGDAVGENIKSYIEKAMNKAFNWVTEKENAKPNQDEVKKRSRMKILEMLQDGKITPEQAEKLLNALEKDYE